MLCDFQTAGRYPRHTCHKVQAFSIPKASKWTLVFQFLPNLAFLSITEPLVEIACFEYSFAHSLLVKHMYRHVEASFVRCLVQGSFSHASSPVTWHLSPECALTLIAHSCIFSFEFRETQPLLTDVNVLEFVLRIPRCANTVTIEPGDMHIAARIWKLRPL
ncbi:hypothetical protein AUEXF2481DRAFT_620926 [Aureobasidium subglaciale EXF-2481]|uniref:Uncharacterized protein n=1 Tax=Aureobasidium subglaciale (strain EXF-2481) TaxID=1043005 RepID=A0A074ZE35_AURSE|nr:uncharacterized protein AUEXF2481DRAFT_620926 [Aureobasidium subglaciale EXF-2481]KEQ96921.1 hypothetical protein AUEXF2481DRAFT_620926 [Aureobasidium subglaciale EXF-2481]